MCCDGYFLFGVLPLPGPGNFRSLQECSLFPPLVLALAFNLSRFQHPNSPIPSNQFSCYSFWVVMHLTPKGASAMEWVTPQHEEIDLNCEVSSYANAEL